MLMKIKLPFTEKFLWNLFKLTKIKDEILNEIWSRKRLGIKDPFEMIWPDFYKVKDLYWENYKDKKKRERFARIVFQLQKGGFIKKLRIKNKNAIMLTPKGLYKVFDIKLKSANKERRKDKKWQMVLFDIPEKRRKDRDLFRQGLRWLGYKKMQQSIWVCPYANMEETKKLIKRYRLESFVELLLVDRIGLG